MHRFINAEMALGFFLGILLFLFISGVTSYQTDHCPNVDAQEKASPYPSKPAEAVKENADERDGEEAKDTKGHSIACGVIGFLPSMVRYMDHHEGFFVGIFTLALFGATVALWFSPRKLWLAGERQIEHIETSANAARDAADVARDGLIATQRAWLKIYEVRLSDDLTASADTVQTAVSLKVRNIGNIPAHQIMFRTWLIPQNPIKGVDVVAKHREKCVERRKVDRSGFFIFPGEELPSAIGMDSLGLNARIDRKEIANNTIYRPEPEYRLFIGGCVNYTFTSDKMGIHQSSFLYEIRRTASPLRLEADAATRVLCQQLSLILPVDGDLRQAD